ncbi:MAG: ABC transporter ATP-binding protein/permease [Clostridiales bacterium]|nr:ABC transporter ATP-binding protein/permease [Clostridiales bacterium]
MLKIEGICKVYGDFYALRDISIELPSSGFVFVNGISGSGKTTLMNLLAGLALPTLGNIYYNNHNIMQYTQREWAEYRNAVVGIVFQSFNLMEDMTVEENLLLPLYLQKIEFEEKKRCMQEILEYVGLLGYEKHKGNELSAGQKQRIAIARAMIKQPKIILADEATGNLDYVNSESILELFNSISKQCLVILISHDKSAAERYGDRIITLSNGEVISDIDNKLVKKLSLLPYKVHLFGKEKEKCIPIQEFDIRKEIQEFAGWRGETLQSCEFLIKLDYEEILVEEKKSIKWRRENLCTKRLSFSELLGFIKHSLKKKKAKNSLIVFISAFISTLLILLQMFRWNDYSGVMFRYIQDSKEQLYEVKQCITTDAAEFEIVRGKEFYQKLKNCIGEENILKIVEENELETENDNYVVDKIIYNDNFFGGIDFQGERPQKVDEIAINQQFAKKIDVQVGDDVLIEDLQYRVSGTFDLELNGNNDFIVLTENANNRFLYEQDNINLRSCDVTKSVDIDEYLQSIQTVGSLANIQQDMLLWGELPKESREIVISSELAEELGYYENKNIVTKYRLRDLYASKYQEEYTEYINMFDYLGKHVKIVGIYDIEKVTTDCGNILVQDDLYQSIISDYASYLNYTCCYINLKSSEKNTIDKLLEDNFCLCNDVCEFVFLVRNFAEHMKVVSIILSLILLIMVICVVVSFMTYNVKEAGKRIGIYKSVGVCNEDLRKMFVIQNLLLNGTAVILANIVCYVAVGCINKQIVSMAALNTFDTFAVDGVVCLVSSAIILFIALVATIAPLGRMLNDESIVLINENEI